MFQLLTIYWQKIEETDKQTEALLKLHITNIPANDDYKAPKKKQYQKNDPNFDVGYYANQMSGGVELLEINGVGASTILTLISETGFEMSKFKTAKHFVITSLSESINFLFLVFLAVVFGRTCPCFTL